MNETSFGDSWDISWEPDIQEDVILIDSDEGTVYLSVSDLKEMLSCLVQDVR